MTLDELDAALKAAADREAAAIREINATSASLTAEQIRALDAQRREAQAERRGLYAARAELLGEVACLQRHRRKRGGKTVRAELREAARSLAAGRGKVTKRTDR